MAGVVVSFHPLSLFL